jgi:hypothetical protein
MLLTTAGLAVTGTLGVTGTSTLAAINASGVITQSIAAATSTIASFGSANANPEFKLVSTAGLGAFRGPIIGFYTTTSAGTGLGNVVQLFGYKDGGSSDTKGGFRINVDNGSGLSNALNIDSALAVTIPGTLGVTGVATVGTASAGQLIVIGPRNNTAAFRITANAGESWDFTTTNTTGSTDTLSLGVQGGSTNVTFTDNGTTTLNGNTSVTGTLGVTTGVAVGGATPGAGGIAFPATQVSVSDVNTLDDYEEGTFTATIACGTSGTVTLTSGAGGDLCFYTKIGRMVEVNGYLVVASVSSPAGAFNVNGLPFTVFNSNGNYAAVAVRGDGLNATAVTSLQGYATRANTTMSFEKFSAGAAANLAAEVKAASNFMFGCSYNAAT